MALSVLRDVVPPLSNLESISLAITTGTSLTENRRLYSAISKMRGVRHVGIDIEEASVERAAPTGILAALCSLTQFESLELVISFGIPVIPTHTFTHFHLTSLALNSDYLRDSDLYWLTSSSVDTLENISIIGMCHFVTEQGLEEFFSIHGARLRSVNLAFQDRDHIRAFDIVLCHLGPRLSVLSIGGPTFTEDAITNISESAQLSLAYVNVTNLDVPCPSTALLAFAQCAPSLKELWTPIVNETQRRHDRVHPDDPESDRELEWLARERGFRLNGTHLRTNTGESTVGDDWLLQIEI